MEKSVITFKIKFLPKDCSNFLIHIEIGNDIKIKFSHKVATF